MNTYSGTVYDTQLLLSSSSYKSAAKSEIMMTCKKLQMSAAITFL